MTFAKTTKLNKSLIATLMALSIGVVAVNAHAQNQVAAAPTKEMQAGKIKGEHGMMKHHKEVAIVIPGFGPAGSKLLDALKLNADQQKLLADAQAAQKNTMGDRKDEMKKVSELRMQQIASGNIDPKAIMDVQQQAWQEGMKAKQDQDEKWVALWATYTPEQKTTIANFLKERQGKWQERKAKWKDHHTNDVNATNPVAPVKPATIVPAVPAKS